MADEIKELISEVTDALGIEGPSEEYVAPTATEVEKEEEKGRSMQYDLPAEEKTEISKRIIKYIDDCEAARSDWFDTRLECLRLLDGIREPKSVPWVGCSNISVMAIATHSRLMHAKLMPAVWNQNLVHWKAVSKDDIDKIDAVRKFAGWLIFNELKMDEVVDDIVNDYINDGTIAIKTRWEVKYRHVRDKDAGYGKYKRVVTQRGIPEKIPIDDVFLPYLWRGVDDSEYIGQNVWQYVDHIQDFSNRGIYGTLSDEDITNIEKGERLWEEEGTVKQKAEDEGIEEHGDAPCRLIEIYMPWMIDDEMLESVFVIDHKSGVYISGKPLTAVAPTGRRPWVIEPFIRHPHRPYGIGLPELMRGLAKELDAIHNQRIDAGTVSIAPFGWYRAASSYDPEKIQIGPGVMIPVDDIADVKLAQFPSNLVASYQEENIIIGYIEKLTTTSSYQMGRESDVVKSRATATGTLALISQGEQAYTLLGTRCQRVISKVLTKILQLYQCFMPAGFAERIVDDAGELLFPEGLTPEEIDGGYDAYMTLDAVAGNKGMEQQVNKLLFDSAERLIALAQDPRGYRIAKDLLISVGKIDIERYLGPEPQAQAGGQGGMLSPNISNVLNPGGAPGA